MREPHNTPSTAHTGSTKMYQDLNHHFWWKWMKKDVAEFANKFSFCKLVKAEHQKLEGVLQPLPILDCKWEDISMDFALSFPRTAIENNTIWVIVNRLTKCVHFIPIKNIDPLERLIKMYVSKIVKLHGVPRTIMSNRDPGFTSQF